MKRICFIGDSFTFGQGVKDPADRFSDRVRSRLEAELVSIAGHYLVSDQIPPEHRGLPVQIALVDDRLTIERN